MTIGQDDWASGGYGAQLETLRSAAKWLIGASASVAALLVAGLQFARLGELPASSWRLYAALAGVAIALCAVFYVILGASDVLTHEWLTLASFTDAAIGLPDPRRMSPAWRERVRRVERELAFSRHELFAHAAPSLAELHRRLQATTEEFGGAKVTTDSVDRLREVRGAAREVVQCANYHFTRYLFRDMRRRLAWAVVVAVSGVALFAYAANPPSAEPAIKVRIVSIHRALGELAPIQSLHP
jgi:hypothetical protein